MDVYAEFIVGLCLATIIWFPGLFAVTIITTKRSKKVPIGVSSVFIKAFIQGDDGWREVSLSELPAGVREKLMLESEESVKEFASSLASSVYNRPCRAVEVKRERERIFQVKVKCRYTWREILLFTTKKIYSTYQLL